MTMQRVDGSTNLKEIGHDPSTGTMRVAFYSGGIYDYDGVSAEAHADFLASPSKGKHFTKHIRGAYPYTKVA